MKWLPKRQAVALPIASLLINIKQRIIQGFEHANTFVLECHDKLADLLKRLNAHYRFFEFDAVDRGVLPSSPSNQVKYAYSNRRHRFLLLFSIVSFTTITVSMLRFLIMTKPLWPLLAYLLLTTVYFCISLVVNSFTKDFDVEAHKKLVKAWRPKVYPTVDVFLPTCGEPTEVLANTWEGVTRMRDSYPGKVTVYCLDDAARDEVKDLASTFGFRYTVRPDRGYFKKAGNLRHGYKISKGRFIVIFDADFRPRKDFLKELLPYMYQNPKVGIVQSPQYFDVSAKQSWLERGAGAVQELFYRLSQVSRQSHDASICVGSNAIYRRRALKDTGGTALIEHSEDVHTGFNLRMHGWTIQYVPVILAKGLCPADMNAFFKQQYRWCMGSLSLLTSEKFWQVKLPFRTRLSYFSGFFYYIHTAISSFVAPIIPVTLLIAYPEEIALHNYLLIAPALLLTQFVYPNWHKATYGLEAWATRTVYGWAHVFAIFDKFAGSAMHWQPTGTKVKRDARYINFRMLQFVCNFLSAVAWMDVALYRLVTENSLAYLPMLLSGMYYFAIVAKVTFYTGKPVHITAPRTTSFQWLRTFSFERS